MNKPNFMKFSDMEPEDRKIFKNYFANFYKENCPEAVDFFEKQLQEKAKKAAEELEKFNDTYRTNK